MVGARQEKGALQGTRDVPIHGKRERPRVVVLSMLFPRPGQPTSGLFVRERMFRVARKLPLTVVAPLPWFPLQSLVRLWRPHFRPKAPYHATQENIHVYHPRFLSFPALLKSLDGWLMALGCFRTLERLQRDYGIDVIDAHFVYPDGYAAALLGKWLNVPFTITARGTESRLFKSPVFRRLMRKALYGASQVFTVSGSLKDLVVSLGMEESRVTVVANGVDTQVFFPVERTSARRSLGLPPEAPVMITVGGLVERKGFHRVIDCLPELLTTFPDLIYLIAGGASPEGDWGPRLRKQVSDLGLDQHVRFLGFVPPEELRVALSASDVFVLATHNEGWANVFLEAMACGLPVVTTDVGGNREVVRSDELGIVISFGDTAVLTRGIAEALTRCWDRDRLVRYAELNSWDERISDLVSSFTNLLEKPGSLSQIAKKENP